MAEIQYPKFGPVIDNNGNVAALGHVYFYTAGTTTSSPVYSDINLTLPITQPVVLDTAGSALIYGTGTYKIKAMSSDELTTYWTVDNVYVSAPAANANANYSAGPTVSSFGTGIYGANTSNVVFSYYTAQVQAVDANGNTTNIYNLAGNVSSSLIGPWGRDYGLLAKSCWWHFYAIQASNLANAAIMMSPVYKSGTGLTVNVGTVSSGNITVFNTTPSNSGNGYRVGDVFRVTTGDGSALGFVSNTTTTPPVPGPVANIYTTPIYGGSGSPIYTTGANQATSTIPTLPANYQYMAYLGSAYVDGNSNFVAVKQIGSLAVANEANAVSSASSSPYYPANLANLVPTTARMVMGRFVGNLNANNSWIASDSNGFGDVYLNSTLNQAVGAMWSVPIITPQTIWWKGDSVTIYVSQWSY